MDIGRKVRMVRDVFETWESARNLTKTIKTKYDDKTKYILKLSSKDMAYDSVQDWLLEQATSKTLSFKTGEKRYFLTASFGKAVTVDIGGYPIKVQTTDSNSNDDNEMSDSSNGTKRGFGRNETTILFTCSNQDARNAVVEFLDQIYQQSRTQEKKVLKFSQTSWGEWQRSGLLHRDLDSVFLRRGQKEKILDDIDSFIKDRERYESLGVPYHRGYLFYGQPGTGKSSLIRALAGHLKRHLFVMSLSGIKNDNDLTEQFNGISPGTILLIEDIDVFSSVTREKSGDDDTGPTLSGLLQCFDGVNAPHDVIICITTNHVEKLDPALIRTGRIDQKIELFGPDQDQFERMFTYFYEEDAGVEISENMSTSDVVEVFKQNLHDAQAARVGIKEIADKARNVEL